jgi:hypothetical protein
MAHLLTRDVQDCIPSLMGEVPARTDSIEQVYLNSAKLSAPKSRKLLKTALDATVPYPAHPSIPWTHVDAALSAFNDLYDGKRETRNALTEVQKELTALLPAEVCRAGGRLAVPLAGRRPSVRLPVTRPARRD